LVFHHASAGAFRVSSTPPPQLDDFLSVEECSAWLGISVKTLLKKSKGRAPVIPAFRVGHKTLRYHPRTIIAKLAKDSGVHPDVISASFGLMQRPSEFHHCLQENSPNG
jgi:hypothetical protein